MKIKKIIAVLSALAVSYLPLLGAEYSLYEQPLMSVAADERSLGDVNGDGMVDGRDASAILVVYSQLSSGVPVAVPLDTFNYGDVDKDSKLTAKDASDILAFYSYISTGGTEDIEHFLVQRSEKESTATTAPVTSTSPTVTTTAAGRTVVTKELAAPSITLASDSDSSVKVTWDKVEGAENYCLQFSKKPDFSFINITYTTNTTSCEETSLEVGTTYYLRICAQKKADDDLYISDYTTIEFVLPLVVTTTTESATTTTSTTTTTSQTTTTTTTTSAATTTTTTSAPVTTAATTTTVPVTVVRKAAWTDPNTGKNVGYTLTFEKSISDHYSSIPRITDISRWTEYCSDEVNKKLLKEFADWVNKTGDTYGYTDYQKVLLAAQVAQKIPYKTDIESRGVNEYPKYPYETFYDGCGDCEDKSIILAGILHEMNYAVVLLHFSSHMAVGISGGSGIYGQYYTIGGNSRRYFYIESTDFGAKVGECPAEVRNEIPKVYILNF